MRIIFVEALSFIKQKDGIYYEKCNLAIGSR